MNISDGMRSCVLLFASLVVARKAGRFQSIMEQVQGVHDDFWENLAICVL